MEIKLTPIEHGVTRNVPSELLSYFFKLNFKLESLLVNLKILASSRFYEEELFESKENEYYETYIEYTLLFSSLLNTYFKEETMAGKAVTMTYDRKAGWMTVKP